VNAEGDRTKRIGMAEAHRMAEFVGANESGHGDDIRIGVGFRGRAWSIHKVRLPDIAQEAVSVDVHLGKRAAEIKVAKVNFLGEPAGRTVRRRLVEIDRRISAGRFAQRKRDLESLVDLGQLRLDGAPLGGRVDMLGMRLRVARRRVRRVKIEVYRLRASCIKARLRWICRRSFNLRTADKHIVAIVAEDRVVVSGADHV